MLMTFCNAILLFHFRDFRGGCDRESSKTAAKVAKVKE